MTKLKIRAEEKFEDGETAFYTEGGDIYTVKIVEDLNKKLPSWGTIGVAYRLKILKVQKGHTMNHKPYGKTGQDFNYIMGTGIFAQYYEHSLAPFLTHSSEIAFNLADRQNGIEILAHKKG